MDRTEKLMTEQNAGRASPPQLKRIVSFPIAIAGGASASFEDDADAALDLLSKAANGIKRAEDRAAETMARAQSLANGAVDKVRLLQARIDRAEEAKRQADAELAERKIDIEKLRKELKEADARIADQENALTNAEQRANAAEKRANDAEAALKRVTHAIRTTLPATNEIAAGKQATTA